MKITEAQKLIGELVITGYLKGGLYIAELLEIIPTKPFRAKVKILALYEYPPLYPHHTRGCTEDYKGNILKENEVVITSCNITHFQESLPTYEESLKLAINSYLRKVDKTYQSYLEDKRFHSCYIYSKADCEKLRQRLVSRLSEIDKAGYIKLYKIDFETSRKIYEECKENIKLKMCYNNVAHCMGRSLLLMREDVRVVYGALKFDEFLFIKHCFIMIGDRVIDPTIFTHLREGDENSEYVVCKSFTRAEYITALRDSGLDPNLYKVTAEPYLELYKKLKADGKILAG